MQLSHLIITKTIGVFDEIIVLVIINLQLYIFIYVYQTR